MKIISLHIAHFGKFSNRTFHFSDADFQLVYGLNESGKTTLKAFIEAMLFGFPKNSVYKPKNSAFYGGSLTFVDHQEGVLKIERTAENNGKAKVILADGEIKDESYLHTVLKGTDRRLYQSIYSFDVFGLQNAHELNQDQIGEFLLFSSLFGSDAASKMDSRLLKQQEALFKPNGRKPELNQELDRLKDIATNLKQAKTKEGRYTEKWDEQVKLIEQVKDLQEEAAHVEAKIDKVTEQIRLYPLMQQKVNLKKELAAYTGRVKQFKQETVYELDKLESHVHPQKAQLTALKQKLQHLQTSFDKLKPLYDENIFVEMRRLIEAYPDFEQTEKRLSVLSLQADPMAEKIEAVFLKLKLGDHRDSVELDDSLDFEWELKQAVGQYLRLLDKKVQLDERFDHARHELEEAEAMLSGLKEQMIPYLEEGQSGVRTAKGSRKGRKHSVYQKWMFQVVFALDIAILLVLLFLQQWWLTVLFTGFSFLVLFIVYQSVKLVQTRANDVSEGSEELRRQFSSSQMLVKQKELFYEKIIRQYEEWEKELEPTQQKLEQMRMELGLQTELSYLDEAFQLLKKLKKDTVTYQQIKEEIVDMEKKKNLYLERVTALLHHLQMDAKEISPVISHFQQLLNDENNRQKTCQELNVSIQHTKEQLAELEGEAQYYEREMNQLFAHVQADSKEDFLKLSQLSKEYRVQLHQLQQVNGELNRSDCLIDESLLSNGIEQLKQKNVRAKERLKDIHEDVEKKQEELAELSVEIRQLEASGTVSDLTHQLGVDQERVRHLTKKWAAIQLVRTVIHSKLSEHKETRLPALLKTASSFLKPLTDDRYTAIYFSKEDDRLIVERCDDQSFRAEELSQATCEQLYLSIRFSLALSHQNECHLPFMMDDSFVHFDHRRLKRVMGLISELTKSETQLFYFTCHESMKQTTLKEQITSLTV
ncbi:AAA family ATPase [Bacillus sp. NPDC077027]|uniref:ATP-binding protein n=1 Tax=Bacillus sp. NPDC077027 TaxID=3390548 RepID=UPI003D03DF05